MVSQLGCVSYFETSALKNINIDEVFYESASLAFSLESIEDNRSQSMIRQTNMSDQKVRRNSDVELDNKNLTRLEKPISKKCSC